MRNCFKFIDVTHYLGSRKLIILSIFIYTRDCLTSSYNIIPIGLIFSRRQAFLEEIPCTATDLEIFGFLKIHQCFVSSFFCVTYLNNFDILQYRIFYSNGFIMDSINLTSSFVRLYLSYSILLFHSIEKSCIGTNPNANFDSPNPLKDIRTRNRKCQ